MQNRDATPQGHPQPATLGYEKRDANAKWIFVVVAFLLLAGLIMHFALAGVMGHLEKTPTPTDRWSGGNRAPSRISEQPPLPRLQIYPIADLKNFLAREDSELNTYGWINRTAGIVHVPIDRAVEIVLQRGLPTRTATNEAAHGPSSYELQQQRAHEGGGRPQ